MNKTVFLTSQETCERLKCSYATLLRHVKKNEIPYIKIGKSLRFPCMYFDELEKQALESILQAVK